MVDETVTGHPYADVLQAEVLDPIGMSNTFTRSDDVPTGACAGGHLVMFGAFGHRADRGMVVRQILANAGGVIVS